MSSQEEIKLYDIIGKTGRYQKMALFINFSAAGIFGLYIQTIVLLAPEVNMYWDWEASNDNKTIFKSTDCKMKDVFGHNSTSNLSSSLSKLIYESPYSKRTITEELDLVCERSWLVSLANFFLLMGTVLGSMIIGRLSEIYGRRSFTICTAILACISAACILFTKGYVMFALAIFVYGASSYNFGIFMFIEVLEIFPTTWAQYIGTLAKSGNLIGQTVFVGVAWLLEDWFYSQVFQTVYIGVIALSLLYLLDSPMWLAVRGRYKKAKGTILKILDKNHLKREELEHKIDAYLEQIKTRCDNQSQAEKGKYLDLFKNRVITFYTFTLCVTRISMLVVYQGLVMNAESFGSGLYVDLTLSNAVSLCSILLALLLVKWFSIRSQMIGCFICEGVVCVIFPLVYEFSIARSAISILGRCFAAVPYTVSVIYVTEIYPTSVRGVGTGFIMMVGGLISSVSPFTKEMGEKTSVYVPFILFAVLSFLAAGLYKVLPETKGKEFIHTVDELLERNVQLLMFTQFQATYNVNKHSQDYLTTTVFAILVTISATATTTRSE